MEKQRGNIRRGAKGETPKRVKNTKRGEEGIAKDAKPKKGGGKKLKKHRKQKKKREGPQGARERERETPPNGKKMKGKPTGRTPEEEKTQGEQPKGWVGGGGRGEHQKQWKKAQRRETTGIKKGNLKRKSPREKKQRVKTKEASQKGEPTVQQ